MKSLAERTIFSWFILSFLNFADLMLYLISLRWPDVNEMWIMGILSLSANKIVAAKAFMPVFVAGILLYKTTEKIVKVMWCLCVLYMIVLIWNVLQFIL